MKGPCACFLALLVFCLVACQDQGDIWQQEQQQEEETGRIIAPLSVGGCQCPQWSAGVPCTDLSYSDIPSDDRYYITTFGGPGEGQNMWICGAQSCDNGSWAYVANHARFGCSKIKIINPQNGKYCVGEVADCGPNRCVEEAACYCDCKAHKPILDVSPYITRHLFNISNSGYSEKRVVEAFLLDNSSITGCPGLAVHLDAPCICDESNPCMDYNCNNLGQCIYTPNSNACDDLNICTENDRCQNGKCMGDLVVDCDDHNPCTHNFCHPELGCVFTFTQSACDDGNPCTMEGQCQGGVCLPGPAIPGCPDDPDAFSHEDSTQDAGKEDEVRNDTVVEIGEVGEAQPDSQSHWGSDTPSEQDFSPGSDSIYSQDSRPGLDLIDSPGSPDAIRPDTNATKPPGEETASFDTGHRPLSGCSLSAYSRPLFPGLFLFLLALCLLRRRCS